MINIDDRLKLSSLYQFIGFARSAADPALAQYSLSEDWRNRLKEHADNAEKILNELYEK